MFNCSGYGNNIVESQFPVHLSYFYPFLTHGTGENCILSASFNPTCIVFQCFAHVSETCSKVIGRRNY